MTISKKISLITIFSLALSTNSMLLPFWENEPAPKNNSNSHSDAMIKDFYLQAAAFKSGIKEISDEIKQSMSDKAKLITGAATIGIGGGYLVSKMTRKAFAFVFYAGALYGTVLLGNNLLQNIEYNKVLPEIGNDIKNIVNETTTTLNETANNATQVTTSINNIMNPTNKISKT